jgi:hypothetical protein
MEELIETNTYARLGLQYTANRRGKCKKKMQSKSQRGLTFLSMRLDECTGMGAVEPFFFDFSMRAR